MDSNSGWPEAGGEAAPVSVDQQLPATPSLPPVAPAPLNPGAENPPWTAIDLFVAAVVFVATSFVSSIVSLAIAVHGYGASTAELAKNPSAAIIVPAMALGYAAMLAAFYLRVTRSQGLHFWQTIAWRWPGGKWWPVWLASGGVLAIGLGLLSRLLPFPKSLPMERFFHDPQAVYMMMFMGVLVAPFAEEIAFRGFLYPVVDRGLQTLFMVRRQLFNAVKWLLLAAAWGYLVHGFSGWLHLKGNVALAGSLLVSVLAFLVVGFLFLVRWLQGKSAEVLLLSGFGLGVWGMLSRSVSQRTFTSGTVVLLTLAVVLGAIGAAGALSPHAAGRLGRILAVLATAAVFAMVHSDQLGDAWAPLLVIFIVGMVLTMTRVLTGSVAPGFLIHTAYNLTLFAGLYLGTDHFRHLERMSQ